jgi:hypothetical protein
MLFKGLICQGGMIEAIEPKRINDKTHFKVQDHGNLKYFPAGSIVNFTLIKDSHSGVKYASIHSLHEETTVETIPEAQVIELDQVREKKATGKVTDVKGPLHYYLVFNPMFNSETQEDIEGATQAHSFFNLLQQKAKNDEDAYLYWGKLKSSDANDPLRKEFFVQALEKNTQEGFATNLYISDFHFFWCARVEKVEFMLDYEKEKGNTLNFYRQNWDRIEAWFKVSDMTLLSNNPKETNEMISKLVITPKNKLNSRQNDKVELSVTPYLSGLRYPLIIEDARKEVYFEFKQKDKVVTKYNVLLENSESETSKTKNIIYSYVIPEEIFCKFSHQVQNEILWAELQYMKCEGRTKMDLYSNDLKVAREYLIALERVLNDIIRETNPPAGSRLFRPGENMTLGYLYTALSENQHAYMLNRYPVLHSYLTQIKSCLLKWIEIRNNELVHLVESQVSADTLKNIRRLILGVGTKGVLVELYQATFKELRDLHEIEYSSREGRLKKA